MESESVLNFEELLAPIDGPTPTGIDLRADPDPANAYRQLKDTRKQAGQAERLDEDASGFWGVILDQAPQTIATASKDLEITAWLIEGLVRAHGFAGLRDGLRLTRQLIETFWDDLYPPFDEEDGYLIRAAAFSSLSGENRDGTLIRPIRCIPFTTSPSFSHSDLLQAKQIESIEDPERRSQMISNGAPTLEDVRRAVDATSTDFLRAVVSDLKSSQEELSQLSSLFVDRCGNTPSGDPAYPSLTNLRTVLEDYSDSLLPYVGHLESEPEEGEAGETAAGEVVAAAAGTGVATDPGGMTRDQAFRQLLTIADFFRRTEPHSPISYGLEQIVRWGRMSLPDLWKELIRDESGRSDAFRLVGIASEEDEESEGF